MTDPRPTERSAQPGAIRRLWPSELDLYRSHLLRLDPQTRRDRFSGAVSDGFIASYAERAINEDHLIFAHAVGGVVRGVVELCPYPRPHDDEGEAAFSVEREFRLQGIGTALFRRVILAARNRGVRTLHVRCLPHNQAMQTLARKHGARMFFESDEILGKVDVGVVTPFSVFQELLEASFDLTLKTLSPATPESRRSYATTP
jgi:GNAT superfamily N-acetyltransferase